MPLWRAITLPFILLLAVFAAGMTRSQEAEAEPQAAGQSGGLSLELNATAPVEQGCRLTFLVRNGLGADLDALSLETVILDMAGQVERLTLFDFRAVPADRPRVRQFDLSGLSCDGLGQVLVNGASSCEGDGIEEGACIEGLDLSSRVDAELIG